MSIDQAPPVAELWKSPSFFFRYASINIYVYVFILPCAVCVTWLVCGEVPYFIAVQSDLGSILEYCVNFNRDFIGIWGYYFKLGDLGNIWEYYVNFNRDLIGISGYYIKLGDLGNIWEYYVNFDRDLVGIWEYYIKLGDLGSIW